MSKDTFCRVLTTVLVCIIVSTVPLACAGNKGPDISNKICIGSRKYFETQEVAEALLKSKGLMFSAVDAGGTDDPNRLAEIIADHIIVKNGDSGYYVNKDESVVLKVFTYVEPGPEVTKEDEPDISPVESEDESEDSVAFVPDEDDNESVDVFELKDLSDETIQSIQTYEDYFEMYWAIIQDYFANYEAAIEGTVLHDGELYETMRNSAIEAYEAQKETYGTMGKSRILGKESMVEFLITYRDDLRAYTDSIAEAFK